MAQGDAEYLEQLIAARTALIARVAEGDSYIKVRIGNTETTVSDPQKFLAWLGEEIRKVSASVSSASNGLFRLARLKRARA